MTGHHSFESVHIRKDGAHFAVLTELTSIKDLHRKTILRAAMVLNITERKQTEQLQKQTLEELKAAADASSVCRTRKSDECAARESFH